MRIRRRVGSTPAQRGSTSGSACPDVFELEDGRFAVIGTRAGTEDVMDLPPDASVASHECIVIVPREVLVHALGDILDA